MPYPVATYMAVLLMALWPAVGRGNQAYSFRIVSTQATEIMGFRPADGITWSNSVFPSECVIQWSPSLGGLWLTNHFAGSIACTETLQHTALPDVFRVGSPSTILCRGSEAVLPSGWPESCVDLTGDGLAEIAFRTVFLSTTDVPPSGHYAGLHLKTPRAEVILRPYACGEFIGAAPPNGAAWQSAGYHDVQLIGTDVTMHWATGEVDIYASGPWQGIPAAYLPVRVNIRGRWHYGWVHIELDTETLPDGREIWWGGSRIVGTGIQAMPATPIHAGQK